MLTCCNKCTIVKDEQLVKVKNYSFLVTIYLCASCGSMKNRSNITEASLPTYLKSR
jgi:hypothetical protein